jgi:ATP-dependent RNA helicase DeaD
MERYRLEVGYVHGVKPGNIVGAIANEAELESQYIGHIEIFDDFTLIDLPEGMPKETFRDLKKVWVCQRQLQISRFTGTDAAAPPTGRPPKQRRPKHKDKAGHKKPRARREGRKPEQPKGS